MTIMIPSVDWCIDISEDYINDIVIENQILFRNVLIDLNSQINGEAGNIIFAEKEKILNVSKNVEIIWNPITVDINSQKILKKLYQELLEISYEFEDEVSEVNSKIVTLIEHLIQKVPYDIETSCEMDINSIFKSYKVQFGEECNNLAERLLDFIKISHLLCGISVFCAVNIKDFFCTDEVNEIYKYCLYEKIKFINFSNREKGCYSVEKRHIIDEDLCVIDID